MQAASFSSKEQSAWYFGSRTSISSAPCSRVHAYACNATDGVSTRRHAAISI